MAAAPESPPLNLVVTPELQALALKEHFCIGHHTAKHPKLVDTVKAVLADPAKPYQLFLGPPQQSRLSIQDTDLKDARTLVDIHGLNLFVHTPYIINLSAKNDWNILLLKKNLTYGAALGCKGVVVHVGKSAKMPVQEALSNMRENIVAALEVATEECPLLLETPAGQGTELLTDRTEFIRFVEDIKDPRLRICVDTCHVFACGDDPLGYIDAVQKAGLLTLVHYNDSQAACGACVDRHALVGSGHIGWAKMTAVAERCKELGVPMVIE